MSVSVDEPIYKTEVVKVSDMPKATYLDESSLLLVAQNGRSKQLSYDTLASAIESDINGQVGPELNIVKAGMKSLSSSINKAVDNAQKSDSQISAKLFQEMTNANAQLSVKISYALTNETDQKIHLVKEEFNRLDTYVRSQNLSAIGIKFTTLDNAIDRQQSQIQTQSKKEQTDIDQLSKSTAQKIDAAESRAKSHSHDELTKEIQKLSLRQVSTTLSNEISKQSVLLSQLEKKECSDVDELREQEESLEKQLMSLSAEASIEISYAQQAAIDESYIQMSDAVNASRASQTHALKSVSCDLSDAISDTEQLVWKTAKILSTQMTFDNEVLLEKLSNQKIELCAYGKSISAAATAEDQKICELMSKTSSDICLKVDVLSIEADELSASLSSEVLNRDEHDTWLSAEVSKLDARLYGLHVEALNAEGVVVMETLNVGDIEKLSSDVEKLQADIVALSSEVLSIKEMAANMFFMSEAYGICTISAKSLIYVSIPIKHAGYSPMSIVEVTVIDADDGSIAKEIEAYSRFICSSEEAKVQIENMNDQDKDIKVITKVMYMKSK